MVATKRTDSEWADYLGCELAEVPKIRETINEMYYLGVTTDPDGILTDKYCFAIFEYNTAPSGFKRSYLAVSGKQFFSTPEEAKEHAEKEIIPLLNLPELKAKILGLPVKAMQMLEFV